MKEELTKISNKELIEMYSKNKEFIIFLEKEEKNVDKENE